MLFLFLLLASASVHGLTLKTTTDGLTLSGTVGELYAYANEPAGFSVITNHSIAQLVQGGDHAKIRVLAPDCLDGTETITVVAQGTKERTEKTVQVTHLPRRDCQKLIFTQPIQPALEAPKSIYFSHAFDPTQYAVRIKAPASCTPLNVGQKSYVTLSLINEGAAGTFDLDADKEFAFLDHGTVFLDRRESKDVTLKYIPQKSGKFNVPVRVLRENQAIGSAEVCFEVGGTYQATLNVPVLVDAKSCERTTFDVTLKNTGTEFDRYDVQAEHSNSAQAFLEPGQSAKITLTLETSQLRDNENAIQVFAKSPRVEVLASTLVNVRPCGPLIVSQPLTAQIGDTLVYTVLVKNDKDTPIRNATLYATGIPAAWIVTPESKFIGPHSEANVSVTVLRNTDEAATPVVSVIADGQKISEHAFPAVEQRNAGSLTGRIISGAVENIAILAAVLLLLAAALLWTARNHFARGTDEKGSSTDLERKDGSQKPPASTVSH